MVTAPETTHFFVTDWCEIGRLRPIACGGFRQRRHSEVNLWKDTLNAGVLTGQPAQTHCSAAQNDDLNRGGVRALPPFRQDRRGNGRFFRVATKRLVPENAGEDRVHMPVVIIEVELFLDLLRA